MREERESRTSVIFKGYKVSSNVFISLSNAEAPRETS